MPTYEYSCRDCGHGFEINQSMSEDPLEECPACSGSLRKVFHPVGIAFKGSGFYKNDARSDGSTSSGSGATSTSSSSPKTDSGDSSSAPETSSGDSGSGDSGGSTSRASETTAAAGTPGD